MIFHPIRSMENTYGGGEDVQIQILVWLPVTSLLRFKSVCKSWRELIESSFFIDLHTTATTSSSSKFGTFILQAFEYAIEYSDDDLYSRKKKIIKETKMFMLSSGSISTGEDEDDEDDDQETVFKVDDLWFSPFYKDFQLTQRISIVGSCNGLICLHDSKRRDVYLWNPATRQFRILPKSITIEKELGGVDRFVKDFVAFGFDVKTKDYKVVWITWFLPPWEVSLSAHAARMGEVECMCRVEVYSLSTDSWRLLEGINFLPGVQLCLDHGIYMNGSYFFVGRKIDTGRSFPEVDDGIRYIPRYRCNNSLMLSFDFSKEIFTTTQFPDHDSRYRMVLSYLGDKMVVFMTRNDQENIKSTQGCYFYGYEYCEIWVLNDHSSDVNKESWTKLHSYQIKNNLASPFSRPAPICISNTGEFALILTITDYDTEMSKFQLFSLVTKEAKKVFRIGDGVLRADVYKQSLVSIIGGNGAAAVSR